MSTVTPAAPAVSSAAATGVDRVRAAIVAALLTLGAVAVAAVVLWQPWGGRDRFDYADLAPHRDAAWLGCLIDGLAFAAVGVALGLAVCALAPGRGAVLANIGALLTGVGGVTFGAGVISFGSFSWYATMMSPARSRRSFAVPSSMPPSS